MNIYVGNLSFNTDEQSLGDHFSQYGDVQSVRIVTDRETGRPRGFGFVEMATAEGGQKAIDTLNGQEFMGRELNINEAKPREAMGNRGGGGRGRY
jgi:RNA recognition motif-containing protein